MGKNIIAEGGKLTLHRYAICDLHPTARLYLKGNLFLGYAARKASRMETQLKLQKNSILTITGEFRLFCGANVEVFPGGKLTVGKGYANAGTTIACAKEIVIGDGVAIGRGVFIYDSDHHAILDRDGVQQNTAEPVHIGEHVWIGVGAIVLKGVTIGDGAVIAAGAVVTHNVPPSCIAAGVPARVVREIDGWN